MGSGTPDRFPVRCCRDRRNAASRRRESPPRTRPSSPTADNWDECPDPTPAPPGVRTRGQPRRAGCRDDRRSQRSTTSPALPQAARHAADRLPAQRRTREGPGARWRPKTSRYAAGSCGSGSSGPSETGHAPGLLLGLTRSTSKAARLATPPRLPARSAERSSSPAMSSSGPTAASARCQARRSGSSPGSITSARASCTRRRSCGGAPW